MSSITEEDIKRWATSLEDLINDPTGLQEFMKYLEKEYCLENIRFWLAVGDFKKINDSEIIQKSQEIYDEFLAPGALYEVNIDGKTKEKMHEEMKNPSKSMFDDAADHVYMLLLKKDCYPRFIRSDHYKNLLANGHEHLVKRSFTSSILQLQDRSQMYSSVRSRIGYGSRPNSPRDFLLNIDASSLYRSQSNHSVRDNSAASRTIVLDDVCPWDSPGYHSDTKLLSAAREQRRGHRPPSSTTSSSSSSPPSSSSLPLSRTRSAYESATSDSDDDDDDDGCACSLASHFRHTCCMGDTRRRRSSRRVVNTGNGSGGTLFAAKKRRQASAAAAAAASSSTTSLQETAAVANRMKRFLSVSALVKRRPSAAVAAAAAGNPVISVSPAADDRTTDAGGTSTTKAKTVDM